MSKVYETEIELRFSDLDAYGHVNNSTYLTFMETARTKIFQEHFIDFMASGIYFVVVRVECDYKRPIRFGEKVLVDVTVPKFSKTSFDVEYEIHDGEGKISAIAKTVMVCITQEKHQPTALPESFKRLVEA